MTPRETTQHAQAALDAAAPANEIGRHEIYQLAIGAVFGPAGDGADLVERIRIEQSLDTLAHRQLAAVALALDLVFAAHLAGQGLATAQLVDFRLPGHHCLELFGERAFILPRAGLAGNRHRRVVRMAFNAVSSR